MRIDRTLVALALTVAVGGSVMASPADPESELDWMLGSWEGVRRDGADGSEAPLRLEVRAILGGAGHAIELEIEHEGGVYRGFWVQIYDPENDRWGCRYGNNQRRTWASLEGDGSVYRSVTPGRSRESRLESERIGEKGWRRTQSVSEDSGATWRVLFVDELELVPGLRAGSGESP